MHTVPSAQPPQSAGHSQPQPLAGLHTWRPVQLSSQLGAQSQAQVAWLQAPRPLAAPQVPPQSAGHSQAHAAVLQPRSVPAQAPPQSAPHSQAHVAGLQVVPLGQPPQSAGHSQAHVVGLQAWPGPQLPPQSGAQAHWQLASQAWLGPQAAQAARSQVQMPSIGSQVVPAAHGPQGCSGGCHTR